ncbi:MAG: YgaP-like transmembrane domain [Candidatus Brocadiales bacterium]
MFECNLDGKQRLLRVVFGVVLLVLAYTSRGYSYPVFVQLGLGLGGIFTLFEGAKGWCALKSLGLKIPF